MLTGLDEVCPGGAAVLQPHCAQNRTVTSGTSLVPSSPPDCFLKFCGQPSNLASCRAPPPPPPGQNYPGGDYTEKFKEAPDETWSLSDSRSVVTHLKERIGWSVTSILVFKGRV